MIVRDVINTRPPEQIVAWLERGWALWGGAGVNMTASEMDVWLEAHCIGGRESALMGDGAEPGTGLLVYQTDIGPVVVEMAGGERRDGAWCQTVRTRPATAMASIEAVKVDDTPLVANTEAIRQRVLEEIL